MASTKQASAMVKANKSPLDRITIASIRNFAKKAFPLAFQALPDVNEIEFVDLKSRFEQKQTQTRSTEIGHSEWPKECEGLVMSIGYLKNDTKVYAFLYGTGRNCIGYVYQEKESGAYKRYGSTELCGVRFEGPLSGIAVNEVHGVVHRRLLSLLIYYKLLAGHVEQVQWYALFNKVLKASCEALANHPQPRSRQNTGRILEDRRVDSSTIAATSGSTVLEKRPRTSTMENGETNDNRPSKRSTYEQGVYHLAEAQKQLNQLQAEYSTAESSRSNAYSEMAKLLDKIGELEESASQTKRENDTLLHSYKIQIDAAKDENKKILDNNAERMSATRAMAEAKIKEIQKDAEKKVKEAQNRVEAAVWQGRTAARAELQEEMDKMKAEIQEEHAKREQAEKKYKELEDTQKKMRELLGWK